MTKKATVRIALLSALLLPTLRGVVHAQTAHAPSSYVVDSGTVVRLRLVNDDTLVGRLMAAFTPESQDVVVCDDARPPSCTTTADSGVRRVPMSDVAAAAVRGRMSTNFAMLGLYGGMVVGGLAYRDESGGGLALGGLAGLGLGRLLGGHVTGWVPLFPCGAHGECRWRGAGPIAARRE